MKRPKPSENTIIPKLTKYLPNLKITPQPKDFTAKINQ